MANASTLQSNLDAFYAAMPFGSDVVRALEADGFVVTHARQAGGWASWLLRAQPPAEIVRQFALAPEIQLVITRNDVQARDLTRALADASEAGGRLNEDLVVVVAEMRDLAGHLDRLPPTRLRGEPIVQQRVPWPWPSEPLSRHLARCLPLTDLFDVTDPVHHSGHFGRRRDLAVLCGQIRQGGGVGVYGLRKVGKTTLARLAERSLGAPGSAWRCAWVDAQDFPRRELDGLGLARRWAEALGEPAGAADRPIDHLAACLRERLEQGTPVLLTVDEFDLLFDTESTGAGLLELFARLRALSQSDRAVAPLSVMFIGRDPNLLAPPLLGGSSNPLLAWIRDSWVGPLRRDEATELLRKLGKRCNLDVGWQTSNSAWSWSHGHPLLHRQFGSAALEVMREQQSRGGGARWPTDEHLPAIERGFRRRQRCREIGAEVVQLLEERYPMAFDLFCALARESDVALRRRLWQEAGDGDIGPSQVLRQFGLVDDDVMMARFWTWYVTHLVPTKEKMVG